MYERTTYVSNESVHKKKTNLIPFANTPASTRRLMIALDFVYRTLL